MPQNSRTVRDTLADFICGERHRPPDDSRPSLLHERSVDHPLVVRDDVSLRERELQLRALGFGERAERVYPEFAEQLRSRSTYWKDTTAGDLDYQIVDRDEHIYLSGS